MSGTGLNAILFLINALFDFYLFILIIRFFLALAGAEYTHPITQFVVKFTSFIIKPLRKMIPNYRGIEVATIVLILLLEIIKFFILTVMSFGLPNLLGLILLAIGDTAKLILEAISFVFLLRLIMYWLQPASPMNQALDQFAAPFMHPLQRVALGRTSYLWIAWILAFVILQLLIIAFINPLLAQGLKIAVG